jgi:lysophospholipase L1-like esterase
MKMNPVVRVDGIAYQKPMTDAVFTVNADGLRGPALTPAAPGERIWALTGGSVSFGWYVADTHTISRQLEAQAKSKSEKLRVVNLGLPGLHFGQELAVLKRFGARIGPAKIIFLNGANDLYYAWQRREEKRPPPTGPAHRLANIRLYRRDSFLLWMLLGAAGIAADAESEAPPEQAFLDGLFESYAARRREAATICETLKADCRFFIQPLLPAKKRKSFTERYRLQRDLLILPGYAAAYRRFAERILQAFPDTVDLRSAFDGTATTIFHDIVHLNPDGNRLLAGKIAAALAKPTR